MHPCHPRLSAALVLSAWLLPAVISSAAHAQTVIVTDTVEIAPPAEPVMPVAEVHDGQAARTTGAAVSTATADWAGTVRVLYLRAERPGAPLAAGDALSVTSDGSAPMTDAVAARFGEPLGLPSCGGTRYHYGPGPFVWDAPTTRLDDAYVFSLSCGTSYGSSRGRCRTSNHGASASLLATAWTYWGDPGTSRSFLRFDLSNFGSLGGTAAGALTRAALGLTPYGMAQSTRSGSNAFNVHLVTAPWSEAAVTWNTQPSVGSVVAVGASGAGPRTLDVTAAVRGWLDGSVPNYGLRLALQAEQYYRHQGFGSAESSVPPALTLTFGHSEGAGEKPLAVFGSVGAGEAYTLAFDGRPATLIEAGQREVEGEMRAGYFHTFVTGEGCSRQELEVFSYVSPGAALAFEKLDGTPVDPARYLPEKGDRIRVTATFPGATGGVMRFELADPLEFAFADGGVGPMEVPVDAGGAASAVIESTSWWGVVTVRATYTPPAGPAETVEQQLPVDTDGDTVADAWELDPANGGTLALGGSPADGGWDEEAPASDYPGDGFSKLEEYRGVVYGTTHVRTDPAVSKDLFVNTANALASGAFATAGLTQLGLSPIQTGGAAAFPAASAVPVDVASLLEVNRTASPINDGTFFTLSGGVIPGKSSLDLGITRRASALRRGVSYVYLKTIDNVYNANAILENAVSSAAPCPLEVHWPVPSTSGSQTLVAVYDGSDLNGNGVATDPVNPLDIAGSPVYQSSAACPNGRVALPVGNSAEDNVIATLTQTDVVLRTGRHEFGHQVIWYGPNINHPASGDTVMRQGIGPAKIADFNANDVANTRIR